jgi:ketosteroid isomerase-like protein
MPSDTELLERVYDWFNARDMQAVLTTLHRDVVWANGLEGGHVYGHDGVRDYWTRQWAMIDSRVKPVGFSIDADGTIAVDVHLTARDLNDNLLFDKMGVHIFRIEDGLITRFDIQS